MTTKNEARPDEPSTSDARLPYHAPELRHLGSVRELTLGGTPQASEGAGTKGPPMSGGGGGGKGM